MSGMRGDVDEHPASSNAAECVSVNHGAGFLLHLHNKTIAIAMNIISTW